MNLAVYIPFLLRSHVNLYTNYDQYVGTYTSQLVDGVNYNWVSDASITMLTDTTGSTITVKRKTPTTGLVVGWADGSNVDMDDLVTADRQNLYAVQEQEDLSTLVSTTAGLALSQVSATLPYAPYATVAAIPAAPVDQQRIEVTNSTGISFFSPLTGRPAGFTGGADLIVRLVYSTTGATWQWIDYRSTDPDARYGTAAAVTAASTAAATAQTTANTALVTVGATQSAIAANVDFTGIPSTADRVTVHFQGVSTSSTGNILVQLGVGTTPTTTGYNSAQSTLVAAAGIALTTSTSGFPIYSNLATFSHTGTLVLERVSSGNTWMATGVLSTASGPVITNGTVNLSGSLGMVRVTTALGTLDFGLLSVTYEG